MTDQPAFAGLGCQVKKRKTRREEFLEKLEGLVPWQRLEERIRPHYFRGQRGRRPYSLPVMLRVHIVQLCYNLSDPAMGDLLYEAEPVRRFAGLRLPEPLPDESAVLHFRHLLGRHQLGQGLFEEIRAGLVEQGLLLKEGTIVDATIIQAPSSTKNKEGQRDPEMRQTRKGQQYYFGMKAHIGVDAQTGIVHSLSATPANEHDVTETHNLLHGGERQVWGDAGRCGLHRGTEAQGEPGAGRGLAGGHEAREAEAPGVRRAGGVGRERKGAGTRQGGASLPGREADLRLCQEPAPLRNGVRYRGLAKNTQRMALPLGLSNLKRAPTLMAG